MVSASTKKPKRTRKQAVHYAVGARVRAEILTILNDGPASHSELAKLTGLGVSKIGHHIQELLESDSIELAGIERVRNQNVHVYRAVERAWIGDDEAQETPSEENNEVAAYVLQAFIAEAMSSLWADKLDARTRRVALAWDLLNLDAQGIEEVHKERVESLERLMKIAGAANDRLAESGETGTSTVVATFGFERSRGKRAPFQLKAKAE
ncbi:MAG TPA: winged helix-turn-helix domain-containing protein [Thermoanaerobaculia bacterium]|nr:winged helix-turn-helix domain-containing protein [Thermoanaerobaculia bacterium]